MMMTTTTTTAKKVTMTMEVVEMITSRVTSTKITNLIVIQEVNLVSSLTKARETQCSLYPCWRKDVLRCKKIFISVLLIILKPLTK